MSFANPNALWLLLVLPPALIGFLWWAGRKRHELMQRFIDARLLPGLMVGMSPRRQRLRQVAFVGAMACLILALARPQWGFDWEEARVRGLDIVMAIDTSKSMLAEDVPPNRLARAKLAAQDLVQQAHSDRLGLVAFAGGAFLQCPLTIDDAAFRQSLDALDVNTIPQGGTAIAEAIQTALTAFKEGDNHRILVLFSDGEDHDSGAVEAARKAAESGLRIFAIGIGTEAGETLRIRKGGLSEPVRDETGKEVISRLNEELLRQIASATEGGFYLPLRGARTIETLYAEGLAKLPKADRQEKLIKRYHERYHWPLAIGLFLLALEMLMNERAREKKAAAPRVPVKAAVAAGCLVCGLLSSGTAFASSAGALRDYKAGKYDQALKEYQEALKRKDDPRLRFNAGTAAYKDGKFEDALRQFNEALNSPDLKLQEWAYYNRGNTFYNLGENVPDPSKRTETWKKALQDYQSSLKLNPQDPDAKYNYDFVKKRLEELQQQQPQSNQGKQNPEDQKDKDKQQQQQQQSQQQQQQDQQQQDQGQQQQQQNQQSQANQQQDQNKSEQQQQQQQQSQEQQQQSGQEQAAKPDQQSQEAQQAEADKQAEQPQPGQMTQEEARQLLEAQKGNEKFLPANRQGAATPQKPIKDW